MKAIEEKDKMIDRSVSTLEEAQAQYERLQISSKRLSNIDETLKKVYNYTNYKQEISNLSDKITNCKKDISEKFEKIDAQKENLRLEDKKMTELIKFLEKNKENYNKLVFSFVKFNILVKFSRFKESI